MLPLVTPTSQIVGSQAVINVLSGERYGTVTKETAGVLKGEYGATPTTPDAELQARVLDGSEAITCRPADLLAPELEKQTNELEKIAKERNIQLADDVIDDVLTYALFPQVGIKFLENRNNPDAFEPIPDPSTAVSATRQSVSQSVYSVRVNGKTYSVEVAEGGELTDVRASPGAASPAATGDTVVAVLAGNIFRVLVATGDTVNEGQPLLVVEAMKMETAISAPREGTISGVFVAEGDIVKVGDPLVAID